MRTLVRTIEKYIYPPSIFMLLNIYVPRETQKVIGAGNGKDGVGVYRTYLEVWIRA